ncbi:MAG: hypothetical protein ACK559_28980, partial [bacterium]
RASNRELLIEPVGRLCRLAHGNFRAGCFFRASCGFNVGCFFCAGRFFRAGCAGCFFCASCSFRAGFRVPLLGRPAAGDPPCPKAAPVQRRELNPSLFYSE